MLSSDLGGGKTTFVRGLARGLGSADHVTSPTFTVSQTYQSKKFRIMHIDMYRLSSGAGSDLLLLEDDGIGDSDTVTVIEWASPEMFAHHPDALKIEIKKSNDDENHRQFSFEINKSLEYLLKVVKGSYNDIYEHNTRNKSR
jgi:tRNA threonylcarbamoyladenosine biosynthesis protein TsaE